MQRLALLVLFSLILSINGRAFENDFSSNSESNEVNIWINVELK